MDCLTYLLNGMGNNRQNNMQQLKPLKMDEIVQRTERDRTVLSEFSDALGMKPCEVKALIRKGLLYQLDASE